MCISGRKNLVNELCAFGLPLITKDMTVRLSHTLIMDPANEGTEIRQQEENAALVSVRKVQKSSRISLSRAAVPSSWKLETTSALLSLHFHSLCSFPARFYVFQFSLILIMLPTPESWNGFVRQSETRYLLRLDLSRLSRFISEQSSGLQQQQQLIHW